MPSGRSFAMIFSMSAYAGKGICIHNSLAVGGNLYLKVGMNGGGLSEGFTGSRCWRDGTTGTIYSCTTKLDGASCVYVGTVVNTDTGNGTAYVKMTGKCLTKAGRITTISVSGGAVEGHNSSVLYTSSNATVTLGTGYHCGAALVPGVLTSTNWK